MKIGILSDTHGWIHPQVIALMNTCQQIIHAGDIIDSDTLEVFTAPLVAVRGNNDPHLTQFSQIQTLELPNGKIKIEHGHQHGWHTPSHQSLRDAHADAKIIIYGHTHKQVIDTDTTPWVINPGAGGRVRNYGSSKCLLIDTDTEWVITPYAFTNQPEKLSVSD